MVNGSDTHTPVGGGNVYTVIVAAGSGTRFGSEVPKQFLPLGGRPVLLRTVEALHLALPQSHIILVLSADGRERWQEIAARYDAPGVSVVEGGASRSESVSNALAMIADGGRGAVVLIHDGARPLVHPDMVRALASRIMEPGVDALVPALPLTEAISEICGDTLVPADRERFRTVQTPQAFKADMLIGAYRKAQGAVMADDAAIAGAFGGAAIRFIAGHPHNIKITHPGDIAVAEALMADPKPYSI